MNETPRPGLVICDITARNTNPYTPSFVTREELQSIADKFPDITDSQDPMRYSLELSPGSIRITRKTKLASQAKPAGYKPRTNIREWSDKSRANMVARLCSLDYRPLLQDPNRLPALITLTYPGDWLTVAPDGQTAKRHLKAFRSRYQRKWKEPLRALWKMEFQRRGACHFHLFTTLPNAAGFADWLSETWADIVGHPDPKEKAKHLRAGTGLDFETGLRSTDAKRVAVYFSKHNSPNRGGKEYQNQPPKEWAEKGAIGRFWGYWNLEPLVLAIRVSEKDARATARMLRRLQRANGSLIRFRIARVVAKTGRVTYRWVTRRKPPHFTSHLGFVSLTHAAITASDIARLLNQNSSSRR